MRNATRRYDTQRLLEELHAGLIQLDALAHAAHEATNVPAVRARDVRRTRDRVEVLVRIVNREAEGLLDLVEDGIQEVVSSRRRKG